MDAHAEFMKVMDKIKAVAPDFTVPPPVFVELGARVEAYEPGKSLRVSFPFDPRFTNPAGVYQGGMLGAALDNVFGPLSFAVTGTHCVTLEMGCTFIKPFVKADEQILVDAEVVSRTRQLLVMTGKVVTKAGKLVAISSTQFLIFGQGPGQNA